MYDVMHDEVFIPRRKVVVFFMLCRLMAGWFCDLAVEKEWILEISEGF